MKQYHKNPRYITEKKYADLRRWLRELGDLSGIVHDLNSDETVTGNQRSRVIDINDCEIVLTAEYDEPDKQGTAALGYVVWDGKHYSYRAVRWTPEQCEQANIVANKAGGDWDFDILANGFEFDDLVDWGFDEAELLGAGFDLGTESAADAEPQIDKAEELQEKWGTELGQTWKMGDHTLFVGSAESAGIVCDLALLDPPFDWAWQRQENALSWGVWKTALVMGLAQCMPLAIRDDFWHWWVWDAGMNRFGGRGHRPVTGCAMLLLLGEHHWYEREGLAALDRHKITHFEWPTQVVHIQDSLTGREYKHTKPYPLADYILSLYSKAGDRIGDLFAGSGTFLIACENLKRLYRGAELLPQNAAVILDRWTRSFEIEPQCL